MKFTDELKLGKAMIGKEEFVKIINWYETQEKETDKLCEIFPNAFEAPVLDNPYKLLDLVFKICFDEEGQDWISWWLYDCKNYVDNTYNRTYIENGKTISVETVDDLWKLVKGCRK